MFAVMSAAALALVGGYSVSAQDYDKSGYCPITKGMTLEYVNYDADGARTGSFILKVSAVEGTLSKGTVTFDQYFYDADGKPLFDDNGGNLPMEVTVGGPEGTVSRMSDVGKVMKVQDIMSKGDASSVPAGMKVGTTIPDGCHSEPSGDGAEEHHRPCRYIRLLPDKGGAGDQDGDVQDRAHRDLVRGRHRLHQAGGI